ncbi:hypothetical protein SLOPH_730 [Spraguea lophii 42_110]|uniref:Uncharacterized protein n=1 Tax=Spraguea lophii (strain 42_110) TaxID=1358809 RepID=S7XFC2_SPRLO|nr:hypothetical protein SLOPH_730 [Spraguea lophii 42_110]
MKINKILCLMLNFFMLFNKSVQSTDQTSAEELKILVNSVIPEGIQLLTRKILMGTEKLDLDELTLLQKSIQSLPEKLKEFAESEKLRKLVTKFKGTSPEIIIEMLKQILVKLADLVERLNETDALSESSEQELPEALTEISKNISPEMPAKKLQQILLGESVEQKEISSTINKIPDKKNGFRSTVFYMIFIQLMVSILVIYY